MNLTINEKASKTLGSDNSYAIYTDRFDPSLLNPLPRSEARKDWGITGKEFVGCDVWHCHESTFLLNKGAPVAGTLKFRYSSDSEFIVESKSMKLYLNSFDMCRMSESVKDAISSYENQVKLDLENILQTQVDIKFHSNEDNSVFLPYSYQRLEDSIDLGTIDISDYKAQESYFKTKETKNSSFEHYYTNILRSRCRHTKQKDTGTAYFSIYSNNGQVDEESLFRQIVSLRDLNEFHEFCAEKLFIEIKKDLRVEKCLVALLYARRGSLDINPIRVSSLDLLPQDYINVNNYSHKTQGQ